jgi:hypothetical protein
MVNTAYDPTERENDVLEVLQEEKRVNPLLVRERTGHGKGDVNTALSNLRAAGWVRRVTRGLYEFVDDPRAEQQTRASSSSDHGNDSDHPADDALRGMAKDTDETPDVREVNFPRDPTTTQLVETGKWVDYVRERGRPVSKSDFESWWSDDRSARTEYNANAFWEAFAKTSMKQLDQFDQPNAWAYTWIGKD